ncbi:hypothetical protein OG417_45940 [Actinoallomurus sp. NBC_01490]|jgi:hypothetical protein|uniref:hypothetical protein n=1 Tax=Actinoallomurus sp. NBC_01490 TaxID=2903557 RepID=UPI002E31887E|nr:hypothetical protein [Actinoallomurus sp. NBC_01490]
MLFRVITGVAIAGSLIAGCGGGAGEVSPSRSASPADGVLTEAQARTILDRYTKGINQANAQLSDALLRSNQTGPMLEIYLAFYQRIRTR